MKKSLFNRRSLLCIAMIFAIMAISMSIAVFAEGDAEAAEEVSFAYGTALSLLPPLSQSFSH